MAEIKILDESISNIIAAGEVVENPASMIKELLENSLDANSTKIDIEVLSGGSYVKISDNGKGMSKEDVLLSIERHATSKISEKDDIFNLTTYGFRGEALASISSVSKISISSKREVDKVGTILNSYGGIVRKYEDISRTTGTDIEIRDEDKMQRYRSFINKARGNEVKKCLGFIILWITTFVLLYLLYDKSYFSINFN